MIFSGDKSKQFWDAIHRVTNDKDHDTLYGYGCMAQEQEALCKQLAEACETGLFYIKKISYNPDGPFEIERQEQQSRIEAALAAYEKEKSR